MLTDGSAIVDISSMSGLMVQPSGFAYATCKAALNSITVSLAAEVASRLIRVNTVAPGPVDTDLINDYRSDDDVMLAFGRMAALGRIGTPDDIARIVVFLASPRVGMADRPNPAGWRRHEALGRRRDWKRPSSVRYPINPIRS